MNNRVKYQVYVVQHRYSTKIFGVYSSIIKAKAMSDIAEQSGWKTEISCIEFDNENQET